MFTYRKQLTICHGEIEKQSPDEGFESVGSVHAGKRVELNDALKHLVHCSVCSKFQRSFINQSGPLNKYCYMCLFKLT